MRQSRLLRAALIPAGISIIGLIGILLPRVDHPAESAQRPTSTRFRGYLAQRGSAMVAFTPPQASLDEPSHSELRREMAALRQKFDGLALYDSRPATASIISLADELHFRAVLITIWDPKSESELATAASLLDQNNGRLIMAVSIGAEGLMEQRYDIDDIQRARMKLLARLRAAEAVEITTTEPWWMYTKGDRTASALNHFGEFTSCNIHALWDTGIVNPVAAASWTFERAQQVRAGSSGPVLVREAGFPGQGHSPRDDASPPYTRAKQAQFWRAWPQRSGADQGVRVVAFEALDNRSKQWREFEANWGLLDPDLHPWPAWDAFPDQPDAVKLRRLDRAADPLTATSLRHSNH